MAKRTTPWKEGKIISIETRKGIFVLAQMLKSPFLRFYNAFREDEIWGNIDVNIFDSLFVNAVTSKSFLKHSNVSVVKDAIPNLDLEDNIYWIYTKSGFRKVKVWKGTDSEKEIFIYGKSAGGSLVEMDLRKGGIYNHPSGIYDRIIIQDIPLDANDIIDNHELMGLAVFPLMNERLYLCYKASRNVDPTKDLIFEREIPLEYKIAIEIMSGGKDKENRNMIIDTYFK